VVNFIGGGNRSTLRKPLTCLKSLTNLIKLRLYRVHLILKSRANRTDLRGKCQSNDHKIITMMTTYISEVTMNMSCMEI